MLSFKVERLEGEGVAVMVVGVAVAVVVVGESLCSLRR